MTMKKLITQILTLSIVLYSLTSCDKENGLINNDILGNNEYQIKLDNSVYDEGENIFAGIVYDLTDENYITAGFATTLSITFHINNYNAGEVIAIDFISDSDSIAIATGVLVLNPDTLNEDVFMYFAHSGSVTIVSKKKVEFDLSCYRFSDLTLEGAIIEGAVPFKLSGYITENNPI